MAQKPDIAAAKARKQKIILAVAGVALVGMAVIQVPKLMKSDSTPAAAPAATAAVAAATVATGTVATGTTAGATAVVVGSTTGTFKPAAYVAGVALPGGSAVVVATSQLASFTLFEDKDPFVQQAGDETGAGRTSATVAPSTDAAAPPAGSDAAAGAAGASAAAPAPVIYATIMFEGKPQQLQVKQKFPTGAPLFVLVSLKKKEAKIGVAGGSFDNGQNVTLTLGKKLTLVDTATGVRYELKLVYTGTEPEKIEGFSTSADQQAAPAGSASTASATATSTP
jgi:hypothetical protein